MTQPTSGGPAAGVPTCYRHAGRETWIRCQRCERPICPDCMRDAAVGFQCPSCIARGRADHAQHPGAVRRRALEQPGAHLDGAHRHQRRGLARDPGDRRFGQRAGRPPRPAPNGACAPGDGYLYDMTRTACDAVGGRFLYGVDDGAWWQLVTSQFTHVQLWHIAGNMLALWFLGPAAGGRARPQPVPGPLPALRAGRLRRPCCGSPPRSGSPWVPPARSTGCSARSASSPTRSAATCAASAGCSRSTSFITFAVPGISWQGHLGGLVGGALDRRPARLRPAPSPRARPVGAARRLAVALLALAIVRTLACPVLPLAPGPGPRDPRRAGPSGSRWPAPALHVCVEVSRRSGWSGAPALKATHAWVDSRRRPTRRTSDTPAAARADCRPTPRVALATASSDVPLRRPTPRPPLGRTSVPRPDVVRRAPSGRPPYDSAGGHPRVDAGVHPRMTSHVDTPVRGPSGAPRNARCDAGARPRRTGA